MSKKIVKCQICNTYTLKATHCNKPTINPIPAKYSPKDQYGEYRRKYKKFIEDKKQ
jgi:rRNA maturation protein Nop10